MEGKGTKNVTNSSSSSSKVVKAKQNATEADLLLQAVNLAQLRAQRESEAKAL